MKLTEEEFKIIDGGKVTDEYIELYKKIFIHLHKHWVDVKELIGEAIGEI